MHFSLMFLYFRRKTVKNCQRLMYKTIFEKNFTAKTKQISFFNELQLENCGIKLLLSIDVPIEVPWKNIQLSLSSLSPNDATKLCVVYSTEMTILKHPKFITNCILAGLRRFDAFIY